MIGSIANKFLGSGGDLNLQLPGTTFVDTTFKINPGSYNYFYFSPLCSVKVQGGFYSSGTFEDDKIDFGLIPEDRFYLLQNGHTPEISRNYHE